MDYELAKQLKDAGFPTPCKQTYCDKCTFFQEGVDEGVGCPEGFIHVPTLSELVGACGEDFNNLHRTNVDNWVCSSKTGISLHGSTPEEAVANLWLKINKKIK